MAPAPAPVQEYDKRTSRELSEAVPQTDILGNFIEPSYLRLWWVLDVTIFLQKGYDTAGCHM